MDIQIFLVAEIGITSPGGNVTSISQPSENFVSGKMSQATHQRPIHQSVLQGYL